VFAVSAAAIWVSGFLAHRYVRSLGPSQSSAAFSSSALAAISELADQVAPRIRWRPAITGVAIVLGLLIAIGEISSWDMALRFFHQVPFGERGPIFGKDIGFYLFSLPAFIALKNWLLLLLVCSAVVAGVVYGVRGDIALERSPRGLSPAAASYGSALLGLFFVLKAWSYGLDRFLLLYGDNAWVKACLQARLLELRPSQQSTITPLAERAIGMAPHVTTTLDGRRHTWKVR